jgi:predicted SAM-dependent methyltransferase
MLKKLVKIDIGAGASPKIGYLSVDLFAKADIQDDVTTLEKFKDNSVDVVNTNHLLEHLNFNDVPRAIGQVYRVLKPNGHWTIEVPDLIWVIKDFLNTAEDRRWGWKIQTIFGLQNHQGEFHKTGFSPERLGRLLKDAGFVRITIDPVFSDHYNQGVIKAKAYKP